MNIKTLSIIHTLAEHYHRDAIDFAARFDLLWEATPLMHKMGRTKTFLDLLMGCECALKSHCFLSHQDKAPTAAYCTVRCLGHDIGQLANGANYLKDRSLYDFFKDHLSQFSVSMRYSLDAYETFFPSALERDDASINYSRTIGNNAWVLEVRDCLEELIASTASEFSGFVTEDLNALFEHEQSMKEFAELSIHTVAHF